MFKIEIEDKLEKIPDILKNYDSQLSRYPQALKFQLQQQHSFWTSDEVNVSKDINIVLTELNEASKHGILTTLKLFTIYETKADCFWNEVKDMFPDPDIKAMASLFSAIELSIHRNAYNELNKLLNVANDEFYNSYKQSDFLIKRMSFIDSYLENGTKLEKLAALCFAEGVILFSSFAFLSSFINNGHNLLPNVGSVIKFSAMDEAAHNNASSWLFNTLRNQMKDLDIDEVGIEDKIKQIAKIVTEHELKIVDEIFIKGEIATINKDDLKKFVKSRVNLCLYKLGLKPLYKIEDCKVTKWFDKFLVNVQNNDFFTTQGSSYQRNWELGEYEW